jgi:hypothetical protein
MKRVATMGSKLNKVILPLFVKQINKFDQFSLLEKEQRVTNAYARQSDFYLFFTLFGLFLGVTFSIRMILLA